MDLSFFRAVFVGVLGLALGTAACDGPGTTPPPPPASICDAAALTAALGSAVAGDTVTVGACRIEGKFSVPTGVTLTGTSAAASTIASPGTAIILDGDDATVARLTIENGTGHGVVGVSHDHLAVRDVIVRSALGRASLGFEDVPNLALTDVVATGPVTAANASSVPLVATATATALYGIALNRVGTAALQNVELRGFGAAGFVAQASDLTWTSGTVSANLGNGIWLVGGSATLESVTVSGTLRGFRLSPSYGLVSDGGATVRTTNCMLADTEGGFGAFHNGGSATHTGLVASGHAAGAILAQQTTTLAISGAMLTDNRFAGIVAIESSGLSITDTTIRATHLGPFVPPGLMMPAVMVGDGIQVVSPVAGTMLSNLTLDANERAGILVDLSGGDSSALAMSAVDVTSTGVQLGCVAQNGVAAAGWDSSVVRHGVAALNDGAFAGGLAVAGIIGPIDIPASSALTGIIGPID